MNNSPAIAPLSTTSKDSAHNVADTPSMETENPVVSPVPTSPSGSIPPQPSDDLVYPPPLEEDCAALENMDFGIV